MQPSIPSQPLQGPFFVFKSSQFDVKQLQSIVKIDEFIVWNLRINCKNIITSQPFS